METAPWAVLTIVVGACAFIVVTRFRLGFMISPMAVTLLMFIAIFGIRPLLISGDPDHYFYGYSIAAEIGSATSLGFVGICALICGYILTARSGGGSEISRSAVKISRFGMERNSGLNRISKVSTLGAAASSITLLIMWVLAMLYLRGPQVISDLSRGRSEESSQVVAGLPVLVFALPSAAAFVAIFWRISAEREVAFSRGQKCVFWAIIALSVVPPGMLGNRRFIIPCLIGAGMAALQSKWNDRLRFKGALLGSAFFLILAIVPYIRSAGSRGQGEGFASALLRQVNEEGVVGVLRRFFVSHDTEMLDYIAFMYPRLGDRIDWGLGRGTVQEIFITPLPDSLTTEPVWSDRILVDAFGATCGQGICPVPSVPGTWYFDFGIVGVIFGCLILGYLCLKFETSFIRGSGSHLLGLIILGALAVSAVRGNYVTQLWIGLNIFLLALGMLALAVVLLPNRRAPRLPNSSIELLCGSDEGFAPRRHPSVTGHGSRHGQ